MSLFGFLWAILGYKTTEIPPLKQTSDTETDTAVETLRCGIDHLMTQQSITEKKIKQLEFEAVALLKAGDKKRAIGIMKQKRKKEASLLILIRQVDVMEESLSKITETLNSNEVVVTLKLANTQMKDKINVEEVLDVTSNIKSHHDDVEEVNNILANNNVDDDFDGEILLSELGPVDDFISQTVPAILPLGEPKPFLTESVTAEAMLIED